VSDDGKGEEAHCRSCQSVSSSSDAAIDRERRDIFQALVLQWASQCMS
jgi:hypothetical protein